MSKKLICKDLNAANLGPEDFEIKQEETVWNGFFKMYKMRLRHRRFAGDWTDEISRELFHRGHAAAAVVYDPGRHLIGLIEQFRIGALDAPLGPWCLEVVAGMVEDGEEIEDLIRRELEEEAGIKEAHLIHISDYYSTPGGCNEKIHLYCALADLNEAEGLFGLEQENEDIYFHVFQADEVFESMLNGRTNNAATLLGLQWLQFHHPRLREEYAAGKSGQ